MLAAHCNICRRPLDIADDPLSEDCGGDCYGCMIECEDGHAAPDLPPAELKIWLAGREKRMDELWRKAAEE